MNLQKPPRHTFAVAPLMDWTDRHCRAFHRALTKEALLYTEMVTSRAIIHGDREKLLGYSPVEHPVALQIGGSDPAELAACAKIAQDWGYDEVNLNCGCPSERVQSGSFGACLMREPQLVADCMQAMAEAVTLPVTVKCRIGVDDQDEEAALFALVESCAAAGVNTFIVHARKAWLKGLSPKENRDIPPLNYSLVYALKRAHPQLNIIINGGITSFEAIDEHLMHVDGVMLGRTAYQEPAFLGQVDRRLFGAAGDVGPFEALEAYRPYMQAQLEAGVSLPAMTRHMLGIMHGLPGARAFRRIMTVESIRDGAGIEVLDMAIAAVRDAIAAAEARREAYAAGAAQ
ncbi:tRNA dihydrouridine(20/20a) synthase DusA [Asticcacaulis sp. ZE23SCel15]|uniref:tRNA dihydrouridine(20/20a) synthase DusA n=1 Tax=Asticcacaulis sp. ZE23SCel15 TaxID=3059027 RepID=UPI00265FE8E7|nr:tRNA dihydrouridine(20/20a) synthase DusA [Asticcacaulis sp. ZE23SCel15]WKL55781.1 tRNA dihydrouridine(20/20a) synthase DusA [Asticcacaulis sp. ZE23SCel15]